MRVSFDTRHALDPRNIALHLRASFSVSARTCQCIQPAVQQRQCGEGSSVCDTQTPAGQEASSSQILSSPIRTLLKYAPRSQPLSCITDHPAIQKALFLASKPFGIGRASSHCSIACPSHLHGWSCTGYDRCRRPNRETSRFERLSHQHLAIGLYSFSAPRLGPRADCEHMPQAQVDQKKKENWDGSWAELNSSKVARQPEKMQGSMAPSIKVSFYILRRLKTVLGWPLCF